MISTLEGKLDLNIIKAIISQISAIKQNGAQVIMVSSGAVGAGHSIVHGAEKLDTISRRQVLAAVGQVKLMSIYTELFAKEGLLCAQVLATREDFRDRGHYLNIRNCVETLLREGIIPIVNENDVTSITELMFTDNDELAGLITAMMSANALIILTNTDGLYDRPPHEQGATVIGQINPKKMEFEKFISPEKSSFGRGGMLTKCHVAEKLAYLGIETRIVNGKKAHMIQDALAGKQVGTRFIPVQKASAKKKWAAFSRGFEKGTIIIDDGAEKALFSKQKVSSILFVGVKTVEGAFNKGDIVKIKNSQGHDLGIGIAQFDSFKAKALIGQKGQKPLVHYNYLFLQK